MKKDKKNIKNTSTCIIGLVHKNDIYIGGDSAGTDGSYNQTIRADEKVFINKSEDMIFGFCSSYRMGQILRYCFEAPEQQEHQDDYEYLCSDFMDELIKCMKEKHFIITTEEIISEVYLSGSFLLGYKKKLYKIEEDCQVAKNKLPYDAVGCGAEYALGAMHAISNNKLTPIQKITACLKSAEKFNAAVKGPFKILKLKG